MMTRLPKDKLPELLERILKLEKLYIPVDKSDKVSVYEEYGPDKVMSEKLNTLRSAKDFFFPQVQTMAKFRMEGKKIEVIDPERSLRITLFSACAPVTSARLTCWTACSSPIPSTHTMRTEENTRRS
jgi:hypothetical protein